MDGRPNPARVLTMVDDKTGAVLTRLEVLRGLRVSTLDGMYATVWVALTTGAFQIGFARYLGASDFVLGLLAGLPAAVGLLQIPAALYSDRLSSRRNFVAFSAITGRLVWLLILAIPFLLPESVRVWAFVILLTVSSALLTIITPAWTAWMSDLVPTDFRGRYFGQRNMVAGIVTVLIPLPAGAFLDLVVKYHRFDERIGFAALFAVACVAAFASFLMLLRQPEQPRAAPTPERVNPFKALSAPLADPNFRAFITYSAVIVISQTLAGQFFIAWQLDRGALNMPYLTVQILGAVASAAGLATTQIWGYLSDKFGSRPLLQLATMATVVAPVMWCLTVRGAFAYNVGIIIALNLVAGVAWAGVGLAQFNLLLATAPPAARSTYVAVFSAITGIVGGVAPVLGGVAMELLKPIVFSAGFLSLNNYKILFLVTALIRIGCVFLLSRVFEQDGRSTRYVLDQITSARPLASFLRLRELSRPAGEATREHAIEQLAELRSPLAVEELVVALDDVSQAVRDGAVRALGEIADARAIPALAAKLTDPVAGVASLAAEALGRIGDRQATPALNAAACGEDAEVRVAALKAIARIGDPLSLPVVIGALDLSHPTACEAACVAVSALAPRLSPDETRALVRDYLLPLLAPKMPRGIRFAVARALRDVAVTGATPETAVSLLSRLATEADPAVASRLAFALSRFGGVGADTDIASLHETRTVALLAALDRADMTGLAYKQTLAAVAEMGLSEGDFYPYLGLNEMARDAAVNKMADEIRRLLHKMDGDTDTPFVNAAVEAYVGGSYNTAVQAMARLGALHTAPVGAAPRRAASVLGAIAHRRGQRESEPHVEEFLLALLLAKTALSAEV